MAYLAASPMMSLSRPINVELQQAVQHTTRADLNGGCLRRRLAHIIAVITAHTISRSLRRQSESNGQEAGGGGWGISMRCQNSDGGGSCFKLLRCAYLFASKSSMGRSAFDYISSLRMMSTAEPLVSDSRTSLIICSTSTTRQSLSSSNHDKSINRAHHGVTLYSVVCTSVTKFPKARTREIHATSDAFFDPSSA